MQTHRELWEKIKKDKIVIIEIVVSSRPELQAKTIKTFRRLMSKQKNIDNNYKALQPRATLTSEVGAVETNELGTHTVLLEFKLSEVATSQEI
jgi:hypothetical protein